MLPSPTTEALLSQVPLFISLPPDEIGYLARTLQPLEAPPGTLLFREAERGDRFYIVLDGQIEIIKALGTPDERLIGVRGPGEYVGEMSLFTRDGLRTASARIHLGPASK
jgi:CRP/FNR family transcriptional regulator